MKFYPCANLEKQRNITDFTQRFTDIFCSFFGVFNPEGDENSEVKYRLGLLDYFPTLGIFPMLLTAAHFVKRELDKDQPLAVVALCVGVIPFSALIGVLALAKAAVSVICASLLTIIFTFAKIWDFCANNGFSRTMEAFRNS